MNTSLANHTAAARTAMASGKGRNDRGARQRRRGGAGANRLGWHAKTYMGFMLAFLYMPIAVLIAYSFNESKSRSLFTGFTLDWYKQLFSNSLIASSLRTTLIIAVLASLLSTVLGTAAAIGISNMRKMTRATVMNLTYLPIINPEIVTGVSLMLLFGGFQGFFAWLGNSFGVDIDFQFGWPTLMLAHVTFCTPYVILNVMPKLRQLDKSVYEAALDLGCNEFQAFAKAVMPDIMPGIVAGFLTSVTMSLDDFVISYFVSGPTSQTLPITIFSMTRRKVSPEINALSSILFVVVLAVLAIYNIQDASRERQKQRQIRAAERMAAVLAACVVGAVAAVALAPAQPPMAAPAVVAYADAGGDAEAGAEADALELTAGDEYYSRLRGQNVSINVYNWGEYISDGTDESLDVNAAFTEATGIKVNYSTFATNEELYSKLRSGYSSYDVVIPSDYMIGRMAQEGMLQPLNRSNIPLSSNIGSGFQDPAYDPGGLYSVPYTWGYVGIIYNKTLVFDEEETLSWDILWNEKYLGNILMFANSRDAFAIAQARLGYSLNTTDEAELRECLESLKEQKPLVQAYVMDEIFDKMLGGEAALAPYYAGDALTMSYENEDLGFSIPQEGVNLFVDAMCIPTVAMQKEAAEIYINFMLEPEVAAANCEYIGYATPNAAALDVLDEEMRLSEIAFPSDEALSKTENFLSLPQDASRLMDQLWTELLSDDDAYNRMLVPVLLLIALAVSVGLNVFRARRRARRSQLLG